MTSVPSEPVLRRPGTAIDYPRALRRRAWLIALVAVIAAIATGLISTRLPKVYEARAVALVNPTQPVLPTSTTDPQNLPSLDEVVQSYMQLVNTTPVREGLVALGVPRSAAELGASIHATREPNTTLIDVTVDDRDPLVAQSVATKIIPVFNNVLDELQTSVAGTTKQGRLQALVLWELPGLPTVPVSPHVILNTLFALVAATALAAGLVVLLALLDTSVRTEEDARERLGLPVLGSVPRLRRRGRKAGVAVESITVTDPASSLSEGYRAVRTNLLFSALDNPVQTLVVTSAAVMEGKTTTACNLAISIAQSGKRVILVDADLHRPRIHSVLFGRTIPVGLTSLMLGDREDADLILPSAVPNLWVVCSGLRPPSPSDLLGSSSMGRVIERLSQLADVVVFDTPPLAAVSDAAILAAQVDGVLLVVGSNRTSCRAILRAKEKLSAVGANTLGLVLNEVRQSRHADYYHEYYAATPTTTPTNGSNGHHGSPDAAVSAQHLEPVAAAQPPGTSAS